MISALKSLDGAGFSLGLIVTLGDGAGVDATDAGAIAIGVGVATGSGVVTGAGAAGVAIAAGVAVGVGDATGDATVETGELATVAGPSFPRNITKIPTPANATNAPTPIAINQVLGS
jgi:hypothetical protein